MEKRKFVPTNLKDITGEIFGRLTVMSQAKSDARGQSRWDCLCPCGNRVTVAGYNLKNGHTQSCGCLHRSRTSEANLKELTGRVFGKLTVLYRIGSTKDKQAYWKCQCACGKITEVRGSSLFRGHTQSCGCLQKERTSRARLKDLTGIRFGRLTAVTRSTKRASDGRILWNCICTCGTFVLVPGSNLCTGHTKSCGCLKLENKGEAHYNWSGGVTSDNEKIRKSPDYKLWRTAVFQRDDYTCQMCGQRGGKLNADHIKPFSTHPDLRLEVDNGRTLCTACHRGTDTYGKKAKQRGAV